MNNLIWKTLGRSTRFFSAERPEYVLLAAARVGGILANNSFPADFIASNLAIELNVIRCAHRHGVQRLLFLGSSCIYPKLANIPIQEKSLLTGPLEPTNRPYALAKIAGIELCWSYNRQFGTRYLAVMPTNLYGPGDNFDLDGSHVIPALIRKFHEAKIADAPRVLVWGSGRPLREFLHSDDLAAGCLHLMRMRDNWFDELLGNRGQNQDSFLPPLINIGSDSDISIADLAGLVGRVVGFKGSIIFRLKQTGWYLSQVDGQLENARAGLVSDDFARRRSSKDVSDLSVNYCERLKFSGLDKSCS